MLRSTAKNRAKTTSSINTSIDGSSPLTTQRRFAGKRVQVKSKKKQTAVRKTQREIKEMIKSTNKTPSPGSATGTDSSSAGANQNTSRTMPKSVYLKTEPVISSKKLHPTLPDSQLSQVPAPQTLSNSFNVSNPTAQHVQANPTAQVKALQDPILMNHGQSLILNNEGRPYFKYGLCRTIKLPPNPVEIQQSITKRQLQVVEAKGFNNAKDRVRDHCMRRLQISVQIFLNRLDTSTNSIPTVLTLLHPFEYELATVTIAQHAHDNPIPYHILKTLPPDDVNILLQYVLLQESRVDSQGSAGGNDYYDETIDNTKLSKIAQSLNRYRELRPDAVNPHSPEFNINYINFLQDENFKVVDGFSNLRAKGTLYYSTLLYNINKCRELVIHHYYKYKKQLNAAAIPQEMHEISKREIQEMEKLIKSPFFTTTMDLFRKMTLLLKSQHWIDPNIPTLLCIGAPNVGKSSLVRALSTSKTQVQSYRFTTRKLTMGHLDVNGFSCQITDSPGLLPRPDEDRNAMEALTIAAIKHLPLCGVAFVTDPTVQGGVSLQHQLLLRNEIRWRFGKMLGDNWIDVATKADLWSADYGIKKNTLPMTDTHLFTNDQISIELHDHEKANNAAIDAAEEEQEVLEETPPPEPVQPAPKKRGRPRKNPLPETTNTSPVPAVAANPTPKKEKGITPQWTLQQSLGELSAILPTPPCDIIPGLVTPQGTPVAKPFPYYTLSTIHLRDVHNEAQNLQLKSRFLKNKKARRAEEAQKQRQREQEEQERHRVGSSMYTPQLYEVGQVGGKSSGDFEENFDSLTLEEYEQWWDALSAPEQKVYLRAINDTENVNTGIGKVLGKMVHKVENQQTAQQYQIVKEQEDEDAMENMALREGMDQGMKQDWL